MTKLFRTSSLRTLLLIPTRTLDYQNEKLMYKKENWKQHHGILRCFPHDHNCIHKNLDMLFFCVPLFLLQYSSSKRFLSKSMFRVSGLKVPNAVTRKLYDFRSVDKNWQIASIPSILTLIDFILHFSIVIKIKFKFHSEIQLASDAFTLKHTLKRLKSVINFRFRYVYDSLDPMHVM